MAVDKLSDTLLGGIGSFLSEDERAALRDRDPQRQLRALKVENEFLYRRVRQFDALHKVALALTSELRLSSLLDRIMELSKQVMLAEAGSIFLLDKEGGEISFFVVVGEGGDVLKPLKLEMGQGIVGHVALTGETVSVPDAYQDPRFDPSFDKKTGFRTRSILATPVVVKGDIIGILEVINRTGGGAFTDEDINLFKAVASSVGVALENARLFEKTTKMADELRDALEQERRLAIEKAKMGAYIPKHVVDEISRNREQKLALGGRTVQATVMFSDLKGFTKIAERMDAQELVGLLNTYMTAMTAIIEANDGIIDKFLGDGIMATFTDIEGKDPAAARAVRTGLAMQARVAELRENWRRTHPDAADLQMRVGINSGEMVAGNIGAETRMEFTVIGDNVNVAARIESVSEPGQVWVSDATFSQAAGQFDGTPMAPIRVKNREQPVRTFRIDGPKN